MPENADFDSWLIEELSSSGVFERARLEIYAARAGRLNIPLHSWLTAEGLLRKSDIEALHEKWKKERGMGTEATPRECGLPGPGDEMAGYRIISLIGYGGMGVVYRAEQISLRRTVALKLLKPDRRWDDEHRRRFLNEAKFASELSYENIVRIYEVGEADGFLFFSMELIDGVDLLRLVEQRGRLSPSFVRKVLLETGKALDAAHRKGIVHGDVKPANILYSRGGQLKLADLGIASRRFERSGRLFASVHYAAPEVLAGRPATPASDLYSLGATAWHLLTGHPPYSGLGKEEIIEQSHSGRLLDLSEEMPDLPVEMLRAVNRLLAPSPSERPRSALELVEFLSKERRPRRTRRAKGTYVRRSSPLPWAFVIALLALAAAAGYLIFMRPRGPAATSSPTSPSVSISSAPSPSPISTPSPTPPSFVAMRMFQRDRSNFGEVLAFIASALPKAEEAEKKRLASLRDSLLAERKRALETLAEHKKREVEAALDAGDYAKALKAAISFVPPPEWGYSPLDSEPASLRNELHALIYRRFERELERARAALRAGDLERARRILAALRSAPLPNYKADIAEISLEIEREAERRALEAERKAEPLFRKLLEDVLEAAGKGDVEGLDFLIKKAKGDPALAPFSGRISELSRDLSPVREFFGAFRNRLAESAERGDKISVRLVAGSAFEGTVERVGKDGFALSFESHGVRGKLKLAPNALALSTLERIAREGGCSDSALALTRPLLLAARGRWEETWAALESIERSPLLDRWFARLSTLSNPAGKLFADRKKHESEADSLYSELKRAFESNDWGAVVETASRLLEEYPTTSTVREHRRTIEEMLNQARSNTAASSERVRRDFDFRNPATREDFFFRGYGGDIGELGFGRRGEVSVVKGKDGLLILKRPLRGDILVEFDMRIERGSELRVCLHDAALGGGMVFDDAAFGPYESLRKTYRRRGRHVVMELLHSKLRVAVDGKQEELFEPPSRKNDYLAFYFLGRDVKLLNLVVTASFGPPVSKPDEILASFDVIRFADIRARDLK